MCFITLHYGEKEELVINPNCRQLTLMEYVRDKCQYSEEALIDFIDEQGYLAMTHNVDRLKNVKENFDERAVYIPVMLEKEADDNTGVFRSVHPLLNDWEKQFPQLEKKIKFLTGEIRRKADTKESRGSRMLERKNSVNKGELGGRTSTSPSHMTGGRVSATPSKKSKKGKKK